MPALQYSFNVRFDSLHDEVDVYAEIFLICMTQTTFISTILIQTPNK